MLYISKVNYKILRLSRNYRKEQNMKVGLSNGVAFTRNNKICIFEIININRIYM